MIRLHHSGRVVWSMWMPTNMHREKGFGTRRQNQQRSIKVSSKLSSQCLPVTTWGSNGVYKSFGICSFPCGAEVGWMFQVWQSLITDAWCVAMHPDMVWYCVMMIEIKVETDVVTLLWLVMIVIKILIMMKTTIMIVIVGYEPTWCDVMIPYVSDMIWSDGSDGVWSM